MTDDQTAAAEAIIGDDADKFMCSELGRTILGIVAQERDSALQELKNCDSYNKERIQKLQNEIWRAENFETWLRELIIRGEQALKIIEHDEEFQ